MKQLANFNFNKKYEIESHMNSLIFSSYVKFTDIQFIRNAHSFIKYPFNAGVFTLLANFLEMAA